MELSNQDLALMRAIENGLPLVKRPYAEIGAKLGMSENQVIERITHLQKSGVIKRFGVVVRHHELGYRANAMVVWDIADEMVASYGQCMGSFPYVTLCYQRPRRLPAWPYNLFTMIHGRDRDEVMANVRAMAEECGLQDIPYQVLFSLRRFKQRGARYCAQPEQELMPERKRA